MKKRSNKVPLLNKETIYKKAHKDTQPCVITRFLFETGIRPEELSSIYSITDDSITIMGVDGKMRDVFHSIRTTSCIQKFNISTSTIRRWIKQVLGDEYTPESLRKAHAVHLLAHGANPERVRNQLGNRDFKTQERWVKESIETQK